MKINDLPGWPPEPGGAYENLEAWPTSGQAILKQVLDAHHNWVAFICSFEGREHSYDFETRQAHSRQGQGNPQPLHRQKPANRRQPTSPTTKPLLH